jgi:hypothetical protein
MHCMNQSFKELCILPPFNNLRAQVIDRSGDDPQIVEAGVTVRYAIPGNTKSTNKTDFWRYARALFGKTLPANIGLTGNGLAGIMQPTGQNDWIATGIPITPVDDRGRLNPYQLSHIDVVGPGGVLASTVAVVPVSWEISCNLCHNTPGISTATDILRKHDVKHRTKLEASKPVLCASCHADPALGTTGQRGVGTLSHAMHGSHARHMAALPNLKNACYACHPGFKTNCQRDIHFSKGIHCVNCHGDMTRVGDPKRRPWVDEPTCASCHQARKPAFQFEEPGKLFKNSRGHHGVHCAACHGPQHAIGPAVTAPDNAQAILQQGFKGTIRQCTVCHSQQPDDPFVHRFDGGEDKAKRAARAKRAAAKKAPVISVLGTYRIAGSTRALVGNRVQAVAFTGTLVTLPTNAIRIDHVNHNGTRGQMVVPLRGGLNPALASQSVLGVVTAGNRTTTCTFTFKKTATGYAVTGSATTTVYTGPRTGLQNLGGSTFTGSK